MPKTYEEKYEELANRGLIDRTTATSPEIEAASAWLEALSDCQFDALIVALTTPPGYGGRLEKPPRGRTGSRIMKKTTKARKKKKKSE